MPGLLLTLRDEYDQLQGTLDGIENTAELQKRGLTNSDMELINKTKDRQTELASQIDALAREAEISDSAKARLARLGGGNNGGIGSVEYRSVGEYLHDDIGSKIATDPAKRMEYRQKLEAYQRVAQHITTDFASDGTIPQPVLGPTLSFIDTSRPLISNLGVRAIPGGPSFRRPKLVDDHLSDGIGVQAVQKTELVSEKFSLTSDQIDLETLGGYVNVARQVIDWGVASLQQIVDQLAARYAYASERKAVAELSESTGHVPLAAGADSAATIKALYDAAALVYSNTGQLPTTIAMGPSGWASLGALSDAAGRQVFPFLSPVNSAGQQSADSFAGNPLGLSQVVTPGITTPDFWVYNDLCLEIYEQTVGQLTVSEPSVVGVQVAWVGYFAGYRPAPNGAVKVGA